MRTIPPIRAWQAAAVLLATALAGAPASGADEALKINGKNPDEVVTVSIPPDGRSALRLTRTSQTGDSAEIQVLGFTAESGRSIQAQLSLEGMKPTGSRLWIPVTWGTTIILTVPPPPTPEKYVGPVMIRIGETTRIWSLALVRVGDYRPATLVVDRRVDVERSITLPALWFIRGKNPVFTVQVSEQSGSWPLAGVSARLEQVKAPNGAFEIGENLDLRFDGHPMMISGPGISSQNVGAGGQATIRGELKNLRAGEYDVLLRFQAANSNDNDLQRVRLHVFVKHSFWPVLLVLITALLASFLATRLVGMLQMRAAFLSRLREIRPAWLMAEPPILPIVWVRAVFRQSEDLSQRFWLTGQGRIDSRVNEVTGLVKILERVRRIRTAFEAAITDDFVRVRAQGGLTAIVAGIGAGSFPDTTADTTAKDLDGIVTWIDSTQQKAVYWRDLSRAIAKLSAEVRVETISDLNAQVELQKLLTELGKQPQDNLEAMTALEAQYAWLKILWERRSNPEFDSLIQLRKRSASVAMLFGAADDAAWVRLQKAVEQKTLILVPPTSVTGEPLQAYDALTFKLETDDPTLGATYLFLHRLEFRWTFELTPASSKGRKGGAIRLTPKTTEPQVVQYAPTPGLLKAQVDIVRNGISLKGPEAETRIGRSSDFDIWKIAERADVIAFGLAGAAAIVSGMFMHYTKTPTFGSPSDYLSLAVWGAGMDQGKNLLMASQTYSSAQKP